ncbi:hypothetical protein [Hymenobacter sp. DG25B]|uniref:hypothetical protein n=1 Tax=Hymenobacter sp. DG25B TaxID=1385664 RepID=UPI0012E0BD5E|nr:hypothetical protein [Hymenobacter sp. DG25B]
MQTLTSRSARVLVALVFLCVSASLTSCDKIKNAVKVNFNYNVANLNFTLNPTTQTNFSTTVSQTSGLQAELDKNKAAVEKVTLESAVFTLTGTSNSNDNFGLISGGEVYIKANGQSAKLGTFTNAETNTQSISLTVDNSLDLKQYLQAPEFTVELKGTTRRAIEQQMFVNGALKFNVTGKAK